MTKTSTSLLLLLYFPCISRVSARLLGTRWGKLIGRDDTESEVIHAFLVLVEALDLDANRDIHTSLTRRLGGVVSRWARQEVEALSGVRLENLEPGTMTPAMTRPHGQREGWELDVAHAALDELKARAVIDDVAHQLLVGRIVYQRPLIELASSATNSNAPSYEATKKRAQLATARIRFHLGVADTTLVELARASLRKVSNANVPRVADLGIKKRGTNMKNEETNPSPAANSLVFEILAEVHREVVLCLGSIFVVRGTKIPDSEVWLITRSLGALFRKQRAQLVGTNEASRGANSTTAPGSRTPVRGTSDATFALQNRRSVRTMNAINTSSASNELLTTQRLWSEFRDCRKKAYWRFVERLEPLEAAWNLRFGRLIHECLESWHDSRDLASALAIIDEACAKRKESVEVKQTWHLARAMMTGYAARYAKEDFAIIALGRHVPR